LRAEAAKTLGRGTKLITALAAKYLAHSVGAVERHGVRELSSIAIACLGTTWRGRLAAVGVQMVAIIQAGSARRDIAGGDRAAHGDHTLRGVGSAHVAAAIAVVGIGRRVRLAPGLAIAVDVRRRARNHRASAIRASACRSVGEVAHIAAVPAIVRISGDVDVAAISNGVATVFVPGST